MRAMVLEQVSAGGDRRPFLIARNAPRPVPAPGEALIRVAVCGVCHTELDQIEGRLATTLPRIPGHQVIGVVEAASAEVDRGWLGARVGVAWIHHACGRCAACAAGTENLCPSFAATGKDVDGGYAEYLTAPVEFIHRVPEVLADTEAAPLLCAGAIGYRSLRLTGIRDGQPLGLTGFGASGHLVLMMVRARYPRSRVHVFARAAEERELATSLGASSAGAIDAHAPEPLAAIIDTTPAWKPILEALDNLAPGGRLVVNAIRKEGADQHELQRLDYARHLWLEKEIKSVANVTRDDVRAALALAAAASIRPHVERFTLESANDALLAVKRGGQRGAKVLVIAA
jgi:propanol-preferring alcohol dehydrogenase